MIFGVLSLAIIFSFLNGYPLLFFTNGSYKGQVNAWSYIHRRTVQQTADFLFNLLQ